MFKTKKSNVYTLVSSEYLYCLWDNLWPFTVGQDFMLGNSLFAYLDKYKYSGYGNGFDGWKFCAAWW